MSTERQKDTKTQRHKDTKKEKEGRKQICQISNQGERNEVIETRIKVNYQAYI